jgi:hypothetical protein
LARNDPVFDVVRGQQLPEVTRRIARVAGRVRARTADEAAEKIEQDLATDGDPLQQLCLRRTEHRIP